MKWIFLFLLCPLMVFGRTYDCFPFFNELELLEVRLGELNDVVDYFVLVESIETQRGDLKVLFFEENRERFAPYLDKIIHVAVRERHPEFSLWEREHYQRNCIKRGLSKCRDGDVILISDLDEIPRKSSLEEAKGLLKNGHEEAVTFRMPDFHFHMNRRMKTPSIFCTVATTYGKLKKKEPQFYRSRNTKWHPLFDAGWHFSWLGGRERIRKKMHSIVEGRDSSEEVTDAEIDAYIASVPIVQIDETFPQYVLDHLDELIAIDFVAVD